MAYIAVYRARIVPPPQPVLVAKGDDFAVHLHSGPITLRCQALAANPLSPGSVFDFEYDTRSFPANSYVIVQVAPLPNQPVSGAGWNAAFDRFANIVAALDLEFPGIVRERLYEGTAANSATPMFIDWEQGLVLGDQTSYAHTTWPPPCSRGSIT